MNFETVLYSIENGVATVTMNRPDALNALSLQLTLDLAAAIRQAVVDGARAVILTGNGRAFCSGGDLREMQSMWQKEGRIEAFLEDPLAALHDVILLIRETPIPFVAAVNGVCAGAGTNFALACDIVIAADDAVFREAFATAHLHRSGRHPSVDLGGSRRNAVLRYGVRACRCDSRTTARPGGDTRNAGIDGEIRGCTLGGPGLAGLDAAVAPAGEDGGTAKGLAVVFPGHVSAPGGAFD